MTTVTFVDRPYPAVRREHALSVRFDAFGSALESLLGVMDVSALGALGPVSAEAARAKLASFVGPSGFALFQKIDHGTLLSALTGRRVRATTYVFGNALIAIEMTKHAPEVGLYVPLRLYVREIEAGKLLLVHDLPSQAVKALGSEDASHVAEGLDVKIEALIAETLERARVTQ
jgi:uncharacterized protein (DUF302 family)